MGKKGSGRVQRKATGLKRNNVLQQPTKNTLKRRGYFAGQEVANAQREHLELEELRTFFSRIEKEELALYGEGVSFWHSYFFIQYYFGCRLSEPALILDVDDISIEKRQMIVRRLKKTSEDSGHKEHVYAMDDKLVTAVLKARAWKEKLKLTNNPFLFPSRRTQKVCGAERLSQLRNLDGFQAVSRFTAHRKFQSIAESCKFPEQLCHSHALRHTRAVLMLASGATPDSVQFLLGHSSSKMTYRYMGVAQAMKARIDQSAFGLTNGLGL